MKPPRHPALAAGLLAIVLLACAVARHARLEAGWVKVEILQPVVAGRPADLRLTVRGPVPATGLAVDLHGNAAGGEPRGFVSASRPQTIDPGGGTYDFRLQLPERPDLTEVFAVVILGPDGRWNGHVLSATTDPVDLAPPNAAESARPGWRAVAAFAPDHDGDRPRPDSPRWHLAILAVWALAVACAGWPGSATREGRWLAAACTAALLWEALAGHALVSAALRAWAHDRHFYFLRHGWQVAAMIAAGIAAVAALLGIDRRATSHAAAWAWSLLLLQAALGLADLVSLHEVDAVLAWMLGGVPLIQWLGLLLAAGTAAALFALRRVPDTRR